MPPTLMAKTKTSTTTKTTIGRPAVKKSIEDALKRSNNPKYTTDYDSDDYIKPKPKIKVVKSKIVAPKARVTTITRVTANIHKPLTEDEVSHALKKSFQPTRIIRKIRGRARKAGLGWRSILLIVWVSIAILIYMLLSLERYLHLNQKLNLWAIHLIRSNLADAWESIATYIPQISGVQRVLVKSERPWANLQIKTKDLWHALRTRQSTAIPMEQKDGGMQHYKAILAAKDNIISMYLDRIGLLDDLLLSAAWSPLLMYMVLAKLSSALFEVPVSLISLMSGYNDRVLRRVSAWNSKAYHSMAFHWYDVSVLIALQHCFSFERWQDSYKRQLIAQHPRDLQAKLKTHSILLWWVRKILYGSMIVNSFLMATAKLLAPEQLADLFNITIRGILILGTAWILSHLLSQARDDPTVRWSITLGPSSLPIEARKSETYWRLLCLEVVAFVAFVLLMDLDLIWFFSRLFSLILPNWYLVRTLLLSRRLLRSIFVLIESRVLTRKQAVKAWWQRGTLILPTPGWT